MNRSLLIIGLIVLAVGISSCKHKDEEEQGPREVITYETTCIFNGEKRVHVTNDVFFTDDSSRGTDNGSYQDRNVVFRYSAGVPCTTRIIRKFVE